MVMQPWQFVALLQEFNRLRYILWDSTSRFLPMWGNVRSLCYAFAFFSVPFMEKL